MQGTIEMGTRVSYEDMANPRRVGTVIGAKATAYRLAGGGGTIPFGGEYQVRWDQGSEVVWSDLRQHGWKRAS